MPPTFALQELEAEKEAGGEEEAGVTAKPAAKRQRKAEAEVRFTPAARI